MTDDQDQPAAGPARLSSEYTCRLCGWEYTTMDGLWDHIPSHTLTQAQYGALSTLDATREALAASEARVAMLTEALQEIDLLSSAALCAVRRRVSDDYIKRMGFKAADAVRATTPADQPAEGDGDHWPAMTT
jgi:hypothetical protein